MTPRETHFVKALIDSGAISFTVAAELEAEREQQGAASDQFVWDLAVAKGLVSADQVQGILEKAGGAEQAPALSESSAGKGSDRRLGGYLLISKLGQGGMGAVYKARQESMDRLVAVKVLPKPLAKNQEFIARFLREARAAGRLSHPNMVAGIDAGYADGYYYFAMEYVEGANLGERLRREGPIAEREAAEYVRQVALALDHAHQAGIVHRDVKPENILVTPGGQAKLCDLGLARSTGEDLRVTQAGTAVGTPYYISPEQACGEELDARSDIYSLGCTLYHLVSGRPAFDGPNPLAVMQKHLNETAAPLGEIRPGVSRALEAVVSRMMARAPADRYQTAGEVAAELGKALSGGIPGALSTGLADRRRTGRRGTNATGTTRPLSARATAAGEEIPPVPGGRRAARWPYLAAAGGLVIVAGLAALLLAGRRSGPGAGSGAGTAGAGNVGAAPDPAEVERQRLKQLAEDLELVRSIEARNPKSYASLIEKYAALAGKAAGTEYEAKAREALAAVRARQDADQSAERLQALADEFERLKAFEAANPEKFTETLERYARFAGGARATPYEAKAREAAEATGRRRAARSAELLAELRKQVDKHRSAGSFGKALEAIAAFPEALAADAKDGLGRLREETAAAGAKRAQELLAEGRSLAAAGKFKEAAETVGSARSLGLPGLEEGIVAALAEVEKSRLEAEQKAAAEGRKKYEAFAVEFAKLVKAGSYAEARKLGESAAKGLSGELAARARSDAALAAGAEGFLAELRKALARQKPGAFLVRTPMDPSGGEFRGYNPEKDSIAFKLPMGDTSMNLTELAPEELVRLARKCAGGELSAEGALFSGCFLLAKGKGQGVKEALDLAKRGGQPTADLEQRLAVIERGSREVEAERLLADFDRQFKAKSWSSAVETGEKLLKGFADAGAVKARADLAALVEQARREGSPVKEYALTFQEGQPLSAGLAAYKGTRSGTIYSHAGYPDAHEPIDKVKAETKCAEGGASFTVVAFALTAREGGPLPDDAEILEAKLCLYKSSSYNLYLELRRVLAAWDEQEITWNSAAKGRKWTAPGGDVGEKAVATCDLTSVPDRKAWDPGWWCEFDVTASLREALKEGKNHGWRVEGYLNKDRENHMNLVKFAAKGYEPAESQPKLILKVRCRQF